MIRLFESSTCFEQIYAHPQEDDCMNKTSGLITLKTNEWSKIIKISRIRTSYCNSATMYSELTRQTRSVDIIVYSSMVMTRLAMLI